ncbi:hypothetical protein D3C74_84590 [compost metagenome]
MDTLKKRDLPYGSLPSFKKDIFLFAFIHSLLVVIYSFIENPSSSLKIFLILSRSLLSYSLLGENCKKESRQA